MLPLGIATNGALQSLARATGAPGCVAVCRAARGVIPMSEDEELQRALQARLPPFARVPREAATLRTVNFTTTPLRH